MFFVIFTAREFGYLQEEARAGRKRFPLRVDFGLREVEVRIVGEKAIIEGCFFLSLREKVKPNFCYLLKKKGLFPIAFFSPRTGTFYKLIPTEDWPSFAIGSVPMHRITHTSPYQDTLRKINLLNPWGEVLDTCMGLGYTALLAAQRSKKVLTIEKDRNVLFLAKLNPISRKLFKTPNIEIKIADVSKYIERLTKESFDCIICDPPTFKLAPALYHLDFYRELYRILRKNGKLYHYLPFYGIRRGGNFPSRIVSLLKKAGFKIKKNLSQEGDILCTKG